MKSNWKPVDEKPPHAEKVIVVHLTSYGKDQSYGVYYQDSDKWYYWHDPEKKNSIEVTWWDFPPEMPFE